MNANMEFARVVHRDVAETLCPLIMVTRRPDGTGVYLQYKGIVSALEGSVEIKTLFLDETFSIDRIRQHAWQDGVSTIIFFQGFWNYIDLEQLKNLKDETGIKVALVFPWDSAVLDPMDREAISSCVDVFLPICREFADRWSHNFQGSVIVKHVQLPLSLGIFEALVPSRSRDSSREPQSSFRFLSVASYHQRKNHELTIYAIKCLLDLGIDCSLRIHSNLDQGEFLTVLRLGEQMLGARFKATCSEISINELASIYQHNDIFVSSSQGEGCNIGLRAAVASGMPVVFTDIPGHRDLVCFQHGVFRVAALQEVPALYPERSNGIFGVQYRTSIGAIKDAAIEAVEYIKGAAYSPAKVSAQIQPQDERRSKIYVWDLFSSTGILCTRQRLEHRRQGAREPFVDKLIVPSLDAGFFSIVNTFLSHKLFWEYPSLYDSVVPIWSPTMVCAAMDKGEAEFTSYCYSRHEDGNVFDKLFNFGETSVSEAVDFGRSTFARASANAWVDPNLTYIHSEKLYKSAIFPEWRAQMSKVFWDMFKLQPELISELAVFCERIFGFDKTLSMHVRHPSHAIEQRNRSIAMVSDYLKVASSWLEREENITAGIILATDQEEVVFEFERTFGDRVVYRADVSRVSLHQTLQERDLAGSERLKEGRQIQHLLAGSKDGWGVKNAVDVILDAFLLSMGGELVHVNSNIATIVSIINPSLKMHHIKPGDSYGSLLSRTALFETSHVY